MPGMKGPMLDPFDDLGHFIGAIGIKDQAAGVAKHADRGHHVDHFLGQFFLFGNQGRHHAKLLLSPNGISIEDLGSTHGTFVDGVAVQGATHVDLNQAVKIGDLYLTVQEESPGDTDPDLYTAGDMIGGGRYSLRQEIGRGGGGEGVGGDGEGAVLGARVLPDPRR